MTPSPAQVHRHQTLFAESRAPIVKQASIPYATPTLKSTDNFKLQKPLCKNENGNDNANTKRKSERVYTKMLETPKHNVKNNNSVTLKHLRRNKLYAMRFEPLPTEAVKPVKKRKHFAKKFTNDDFKLACIV